MKKKVFCVLFINLLLITFLITANTSIAEQQLPVPSNMLPSGWNETKNVPHGKYVTLTYNTTVFSEGKQTMCVYEPPGFNKNDKTKKYGIVFLMPGFGNVWKSWIDDGGRANIIADNLIAEKKLKPLLIVSVTAHVNSFEKDLFDNIIPTLEKEYPDIIYKDAIHRGLAGFSYGGGQALNIGSSHLDKFAHIGAFSAGPITMSPEARFPNGGAEVKQKLKTLYLTFGSKEQGACVPIINLHDYCLKNSIPHFYYVVPNEGHWFGVWTPGLWNFLQMAELGGITGTERKMSYDGGSNGGTTPTLSPLPEATPTPAPTNLGSEPPTPAPTNFSSEPPTPTTPPNNSGNNVSIVIALIKEIFEILLKLFST